MSTRAMTPPRAALTTPTPAKPRGGRRIIWHALAYLVLIIFALIYIFPFLIELGTSFKTDADATANPLNPIPQTWTTAAFHQLSQANFARWFTNSTVVALFVTAGRIFFDSLAGYALARLRFRGRRIVNAGVIGIMAIPAVVLLIPRYLVIVQLGLFNSYLGMIIPLMVDAAGIFIMRQFFITIPLEVEEAARIDGAGTFRLFWSVVLPMARPALITLTIISFQGSWNEFSYFLVATNDPNLNTLTTGVATMIAGGEGSANQFPFKLAAALLMTIPVAAVFFIFQRYFIRGASSGSVKG